MAPKSVLHCHMGAAISQIYNCFYKLHARIISQERHLQSGFALRITAVILAPGRQQAVQIRVWVGFVGARNSKVLG